MEGLDVHVHSYHKGSIKVGVAEELKEVRVWIPGEFIAFTLEQEYVQTYFN